MARAARGNPRPTRALFVDPTTLDAWLGTWLERLVREPGTVGARADAMDRVNPVYIPRNHKVEEALDAATASDLEPFERLLTVIERPFERRAGLEAYEVRAPESFGPYRTFCGT